MIKCSECGYENMDGLDYCDGCGAKLQTAANTAGPAEPSAETHQPALSATAPASVAAEPVGAGHGTEAVAPASSSVEQTSTVNSGLTPDEVPPAEPAATAQAETAKAPTGELRPSPAPAPTAAPSPPFKAKLAVTRGGRRGQEFELEPGNNLVGRWDPETGSFPEVDLDADDPEAKISRKHALIRLESGHITIEDIGSLNGTYVNRQPRLQPGNPIDLKDGDEIIIGKTFLKLSVSPVS